MTALPLRFVPSEATDVMCREGYAQATEASKPYIPDIIEAAVAAAPKTTAEQVDAMCRVMWIEAEHWSASSYYALETGDGHRMTINAKEVERRRSADRTRLRAFLSSAFGCRFEEEKVKS